MAETKQAVVIVPIVLEVAEIEVPVAVRVPVDVRHAVVAVGVYMISHLNHRKRRRPLSVFYAESLLHSLSHRLI